MSNDYPVLTGYQDHLAGSLEFIHVSEVHPVDPNTGELLRFACRAESDLAKGATSGKQERCSRRDHQQ
jgi:hypothetical protein